MVRAVGPNSPPEELAAAVAELAAPKKAIKKAAPRKAAKKAAKKAPRKKAVKRVAKKAAAVVEPPPEPPVDPWLRPRLAYDQLMKGSSWDAVALEHEFGSIQEATMAVRAYIEHVSVLTADQEQAVAKQVELSRLNKMWADWYEAGTTLRDKDAAAVLLRISKLRAELLELGSMSQRAGATQTIVIAAGADMAGDLRAIAERMAQPQAAIEAAQAQQAQHVVDVPVLIPTP